MFDLRFWWMPDSHRTIIPTRDSRVVPSGAYWKLLEIIDRYRRPAEEPTSQRPRESNKELLESWLYLGISPQVVKNRLSNHGSATKAQQLRLRNYGSETTPQQLKSPLQKLRFSNYASETSPQQPKPVLASETSLQQLRCSNQTLRMRNQTLTCNFLILNPPPFALLRTCQVSMCTSDFKSTPLSPCYTHVKFRCVRLILNPPPFRLATHMSSLDVYFWF